MTTTAEAAGLDPDVDVEVPVLVIGGGGCGLAASIFLSDLGVEHLLIERHPTTSPLPKASYLNQRTMRYCASTPSPIRCTPRGRECRRSSAGSDG